MVRGSAEYSHRKEISVKIGGGEGGLFQEEQEMLGEYEAFVRKTRKQLDDMDYNFEETGNTEGEKATSNDG